MNCPACGTDNREGARFCRGCGASLIAPAPMPDVEGVEPAAAEQLVTASTEEVEGSEAAAAAQAEPEPAPTEPEPAPGEAGVEVPVTLPTEVAPAPEPAAGPAEPPPAEGEIEAVAPAVPAPEVAAEVEAQAPVPEADVDEASEPVPDDESEAFWRDEAAPLEPLPPGTVVDGRYALGEPIDVQEHQILYQAHDLQRCWQCGHDGNAPSEAFCARCGAALDRKPLVRLLEVAAEGAAEPGAGERVAARVEHEGRLLLVLAEPAAAPPPQAAAPGALRLVTGQRSVPGQVRELNEDSVLTFTLAPVFQSEVQPLIGLYAVADGMGGHEGGEIASKLALQVLADHVLQQTVVPALHDGAAVTSDQVLLTHLRQAIEAANDAVYLARQRRESDMGTTLTVALVVDGRLLVAHVGDCRAFRWNASGLEQLTTDHSVVATMVANGQITPDELYTHPHRSIIIRSIGDKPAVQVDTGVWPLAAGDRLVVCSDGLWEMIRNEGIADVLLAEADPQAACDLLASRANAAGGEDNISVVVVQVEEV